MCVELERSYGTEGCNDVVLGTNVEFEADFRRLLRNKMCANNFLLLITSDSNEKEVEEFKRRVVNDRKFPHDLGAPFSYDLDFPDGNHQHATSVVPILRPKVQNRELT